MWIEGTVEPSDKLTGSKGKEVEDLVHFARPEPHVRSCNLRCGFFRLLLCFHRGGKEGNERKKSAPHEQPRKA